MLLFIINNFFYYVSHDILSCFANFLYVYIIIFLCAVSSFSFAIKQPVRLIVALFPDIYSML
jgi:hypothetical protein